MSEELETAQVRQECQELRPYTSRTASVAARKHRSIIADVVTLNTLTSPEQL